MVAKTLERMILIAIGLTTAVMIGMPVLIYSIELLSDVSELERAQFFANCIHNLTAIVDEGYVNESSIQIRVPNKVQVFADGNVLTVKYDQENQEAIIWAEMYLHQIRVSGLEGTGLHLVTVRLLAETIELDFQQLST